MINSINTANTAHKNNNQISFDGLKENLKIGEKVLKNFQQDFPSISSGTYLRLKILQHDDIDSPVIDRLIVARRKCDKNIRSLRVLKAENKPYLSVETYIDKLKSLIAVNKTANCNEIADLMQYDLINRGVQDSHISMLWVFNENPDRVFDHLFPVFGLKPGARLIDPETWGNNAVIIDGWLKFVKPAKEGLDYILQTFGFKPKTSELRFSSFDLDDRKGDWFM